MLPQPPDTVRAKPDDVMAESYRYWTEGSSYGLLDHASACALLAMGGGETSFRWKWQHKSGHFFECVVGDHGHAFGEFQHQMPRIRIIERETGIDISKTALADPDEGAVSHWDNLRAADWEISDRKSFGYKRVRPALIEAPTLMLKVAVLVRLFEQSAHQERDTSIRFALGNAYSERFQNGKMA
jgi:hypothetical protein